MKKRISLALGVCIMFIGMVANAQTKPAPDKSKRPSPPAIVTETLANGTIVSVDYSQPSLKGRAIGSELAPYGKVWRTGANEATVFEVKKEVKINGKMLAAGKYSIFTIPGEKEWTIIFNKTWEQWGEANYKEADDALRIIAKPSATKESMEKMTFKISNKGNVDLFWGNVKVGFTVK
jgi:hypothetical protein